MVTSPVEQVTVRGALPRYALTAVLARTADAGAGVGVVLLAATGLGGALLGGLLAAALTAPHLLGTRIGRLVDRARDPRRPLAAGCAGYASALVVATGALVLGSPWIGAVALLAAGACGPLLTGGFSSLTSGLGASPNAPAGSTPSPTVSRGPPDPRWWLAWPPWPRPRRACSFWRARWCWPRSAPEACLSQGHRAPCRRAAGGSPCC